MIGGAGKSGTTYTITDKESGEFVMLASQAKGLLNEPLRFFSSGRALDEEHKPDATNPYYLGKLVDKSEWGGSVQTLFRCKVQDAAIENKKERRLQCADTKEELASIKVETKTKVGDKTLSSTHRAVNGT